MKKCAKCKEEKSTDNFYYNKSQKRYDSWCKGCMRIHWEKEEVKEKQKLRKRELRKVRRADGLCQVCGHQKEDITKSCCEICLQRVRDYKKTKKGKQNHEIGRKKRQRSAYGIWRRIKDQAGYRELDFNLDKEDIIIPEVCPLLGIPLVFGGKPYNSPSLDRIDNTKGYVKGNVWVISKMANVMKQNATIEQLRTFAKNVQVHFPE